MKRRSLLAVAAILVLVGVLLVALNGAGSGTPAPSGGPTPDVSGSPSPTPTPSGSPVVSIYPIAPVDPTDACGLFKAILTSAKDNQRFGALALKGENLTEIAEAADAYVRATEDWDELAPKLIAAAPIAANKQSASFAIQALEFTSIEVAQSIGYLAQVIRGEATDQTLADTAAAFADPTGYPALQVMLGFDLELCGTTVR
jgi:hypothetical protein